MNEVLIAEQSNQVMSWDNKEKLDLIRKTIANTVTPDEFELFIAMARASGLDPLQRQIYAVSRQGKMTVQTGIDGYRLIADRTGKHMGTKGPFIEMGEGKYPISAKVIVLKLVHGHIVEFEATCYWEEYAPIFNGKLGAMWEKMPRTMLGKVAEALALRRAFPANLSGLYTSEEMDQADIKTFESANRHEAMPIKKETISHQETIIEAEVEDDEELEKLEITLLERASEQANNGMKALTDWFKSLPKDHQDIIRPAMAEPKKIATKVDKQGQR